MLAYKGNMGRWWKYEHIVQIYIQMRIPFLSCELQIICSSRENFLRHCDQQIPFVPFSLNKIIIVCSTSLYFYPTCWWLSSLKDVSWKIYCINWMPMMLTNKLGAKHSILLVCFLFACFICSHVLAGSIQRFKSAWKMQLSKPWTCEDDLYEVRIDCDVYW